MKLNNQIIAFQDYFCPPQQYFWHWAENGQIMEWQNGTTICYREDLSTIMTDIQLLGLPPLGSILLVLAACQDTWFASTANLEMLYAVKNALLEKEKHNPLLKDIDPLLTGVTNLLDRISELPKEFRSGTARTHLLQVIFETSQHKTTQQQAKSLISEWESGRLDGLILFQTTKSITCQHFIADLKNLYAVSKVYETTDQLRQKLRTGISTLPMPPDVLPPLEETRTLLEQLADDPETESISRLIKRLLAVLHIPMHSQDSSDQPVGGVADITNRGNFDRLLLSELANDDIVLMARLANNEALYLRREQPPTHQNPERIILLDTTLKLWGIPRIFAMSAALACVVNNKANATIEGFALKGKSSVPIDLTTKEGVTTALEHLDPSLHCGEALTSFLTTQTFAQETENFFITTEETLNDHTFIAHLATIRPLLNFLITVNRSGELQFFELIEGRMKLLSKAKLDLEEILFPSVKKTKPKSKHISSEFPAFLQEETAPLLYPSLKVRVSQSHAFDVDPKGLLCVTTDQRLLYWSKEKTGAHELVEFIESGRYTFGQGDGNVYIMVDYSSGVQLYSINGNQVTRFDFSHTIQKADEVIFDSETLSNFYVTLDTSAFCINAFDGTIVYQKPMLDVIQKIKKLKSVAKEPYLKNIHQSNQSGYHVLSRVQQVYISEGSLCVGSHKLVRHQVHSTLKWIDFQGHNHIDKGIEIKPPKISNPNLKFTRYTWPDGSSVVFDSRGLLHLQSSDRSIPNVTILLIINRPVACWSSDGQWCGNVEFLPDSTKAINSNEFYIKYIQTFIDTIG
ncbi:hypothetical protein QNI16_04475 [Cytophagaceae bacterium YF14B1]|uniref:Uncharacterized protein n=1 Tax=Xanthocytophaga flava TaxID=3048013 RepID=A0AAE3U4I2_9BACT|nr:hypothetical protein [Xanthocytophaga flavus]MDJ1479729.1 hypothetical protein [Xanthocytophaga flavus]